MLEVSRCLLNSNQVPSLRGFETTVVVVSETSFTRPFGLTQVWFWIDIFG